MRTTIRAALTFAAFALLAFAGDAAAQVLDTASMTVRAQVRANCKVQSITTLDFTAAYDPTDPAALGGSGTVTVKCTKGSTFKIAADDGANPAAGIRYMANGAETLGYTLAAVSGGAPVPLPVDGTAVGSYSVADVNVPVAVTIQGEIAPSQNVSATGTGVYFTDTVVVTVAF